jgi:hypothetical protein
MDEQCSWEVLKAAASFHSAEVWLVVNTLGWVCCLTHSCADRHGMAFSGRGRDALECCCHVVPLPASRQTSSGDVDGAVVASYLDYYVLHDDAQ